MSQVQNWKIRDKGLDTPLPSPHFYHNPFSYIT